MLYRFILGLLYIVSIAQSQPLYADNAISVNLIDGSELHLSVYRAQGESLLIILPSEHGITDGLTNLAKELSNKGIEVWIPDPFTTWFLPEIESSLSKIPLYSYEELITEAEKTNKNIYLFSNDRGSGVLLEAARAWQSNSDGVLSGVLLVSPDLYISTPVAGEDGEFLSVAQSTNLPVFIFLPSKSTLALRIKDTVAVLEKGGSEVYIQSLQNVRNRFFFRPDATDLEQQMTAAFAENILQSMKLTGRFAKQREARELISPANNNKSKTTGGLRKYSGQFRPQDFFVSDVNGATHSLSKHKGKVVIVNFWASWCPPCVHEMPSMSRLNAELRDRSFTILAINLGEELEEIHEFLMKHPVNFPVLLDPQQVLPGKWKVFAFPTSYILDKNGSVRYSVAGGIDWTSEQVKIVINALLDQK